MGKYIYEKPSWRDFTFDESLLYKPLVQLRHEQGRLFGKLDALGFDVQKDLLLNSVSDEVVTSSEIEGEYLNRSSVRSSVAKRLGLDTAGVKNVDADHYTEGVVEMTLDATQNYNSPVTSERLFGWHAALFPTGRSGIRRITTGAYRVDEVAIVSGAIGKEKTHYVAPPPECVPGEIEVYLLWLETEQNIDPYIKAGIAHIWFEIIHPFDDGNGRIGRAIADLMLARAESNSSRYYSLSSQILKERRSYYDELESATSYSGDIGRWISWFIECLKRAIEASEDELEIVKAKKTKFDRMKNAGLNERQLSMLNKLMDKFEGKLTTAKWAQFCKCSHDTALRDIEDLIEKKILLRSPAGGRSTSYEMAGEV